MLWYNRSAASLAVRAVPSCFSSVSHSSPASSRTFSQSSSGSASKRAVQLGLPPARACSLPTTLPGQRQPLLRLRSVLSDGALASRLVPHRCWRQRHAVRWCLRGQAESSAARGHRRRRARPPVSPPAVDRRARTARTSRCALPCGTTARSARRGKSGNPCRSLRARTPPAQLRHAYVHVCLSIRGQQRFLGGRGYPIR